MIRGVVSHPVFFKLNYQDLDQIQKHVQPIYIKHKSEAGDDYVSGLREKTMFFSKWCNQMQHSSKNYCIKYVYFLGNTYLKWSSSQEQHHRD